MSVFDVSKFDPQPSPELICCICYCVLHQPRECRCRHVFCKKCIETWLSNHFTCPTCRTHVRGPHLRPVLPLVQNMLNNLNMICDFREHGCQSRVTMENYENHIKTCDYQVLSCRYNGCDVKMPKNTLTDHEQECPLRTVICEQGCGLTIQQREMDSHNCVEALKESLKAREERLAQYRVFVRWLRQKIDLMQQVDSGGTPRLQARYLRDILNQILRFWPSSQEVSIDQLARNVSTGASNDVINDGSSIEDQISSSLAQASLLERLMEEASASAARERALHRRAFGPRIGNDDREQRGGSADRDGRARNNFIQLNGWVYEDDRWPMSPDSDYDELFYPRGHLNQAYNATSSGSSSTSVSSSVHSSQASQSSNLTIDDDYDGSVNNSHEENPAEDRTDDDTDRELNVVDTDSESHSNVDQASEHGHEDSNESQSVRSNNSGNNDDSASYNDDTANYNEDSTGDNEDIAGDNEDSASDNEDSASDNEDSAGDHDDTAVDSGDDSSDNNDSYHSSQSLADGSDSDGGDVDNGSSWASDRSGPAAAINLGSGDESNASQNESEGRSSDDEHNAGDEQEHSPAVGPRSPLSEPQNPPEEPSSPAISSHSEISDNSNSPRFSSDSNSDNGNEMSDDSSHSEHDNSHSLSDHPPDSDGVDSAQSRNNSVLYSASHHDNSYHSHSDDGDAGSYVSVSSASENDSPEQHPLPCPDTSTAGEPPVEDQDSEVDQVRVLPPEPSCSFTTERDSGFGSSGRRSEDSDKNSNDSDRMVDDSNQKSEDSDRGFATSPQHQTQNGASPTPENVESTGSKSEPVSETRLSVWKSDSDTTSLDYSPDHVDDPPVPSTSAVGADDGTVVEEKSETAAAPVGEAGAARPESPQPSASQEAEAPASLGPSLDHSISSDNDEDRPEKSRPVGKGKGKSLVKGKGKALPTPKPKATPDDGNDSDDQADIGVGRKRKMLVRRLDSSSDSDTSTRQQNSTKKLCLSQEQSDPGSVERGEDIGSPAAADDPMESHPTDNTAAGQSAENEGNVNRNSRVDTQRKNVKRKQPGRQESVRRSRSDEQAQTSSTPAGSSNGPSTSDRNPPADVSSQSRCSSTREFIKNELQIVLRPFFARLMAAVPGVERAPAVERATTYSPASPPQGPYSPPGPPRIIPLQRQSPSSFAQHRVWSSVTSSFSTGSQVRTMPSATTQSRPQVSNRSASRVGSPVRSSVSSGSQVRAAPSFSNATNTRALIGNRSATRARSPVRTRSLVGTRSPIRARSPASASTRSHASRAGSRIPVRTATPNRHRSPVSSSRPLGITRSSYSTRSTSSWSPVSSRSRESPHTEQRAMRLRNRRNATASRDRDHEMTLVMIPDIPVPPSTYQLLNMYAADDDSDMTWSPSSFSPDSD